MLLAKSRVLWRRFIASLRVARKRILLAVFVIKFYPILIKCLDDTSWKVLTNQITYFLQSHRKFSSWMLKKCFVLKRVRISRNTLRPALAVSCRFVCLIWRGPSSFFTQGQSCSRWKIRKENSDSIPFRRHLEKTLRGR